jgi:hypothetical protein
MAAPHLSQGLQSGQEDFLEAKQGGAERTEGELGRAATVFRKAKACEFACVDFSKKLRVVDLHIFVRMGSGQLALSPDQARVVQLGGQRLEGLIQVQDEIAGLETQPKTVYSRIRAIRFCLIRAIGRIIRRHFRSFQSRACRYREDYPASGGNEDQRQNDVDCVSRSDSGLEHKEATSEISVAAGFWFKLT